MYIYVYKDEDSSYIDVTKDEYIKDLVRYKKGESWILNKCRTYHTNYIDKEQQKDIDKYLEYYECKYIKNIESSVIPFGIDDIDISINDYNVDLIEACWDFNPKIDIWIRSQEVEYDNGFGIMYYKVDSFVTNDRKHLYNVIYNIGNGTSPINLNSNSFEKETFSNYIDYSKNWAIFTYFSPSKFSGEDKAWFSPHPDNIYKYKERNKEDILKESRERYKEMKEENNSITLKYFDDTSLGNTMNKSIEDLWVNSMKDYVPDETIWDLDQIREMTASIQEYFYLPEQKKWTLSVRQLRTIVENLAVVSMSLADIANGKIKVDKGQLDYLSKKLAYIFTTIDKDLRHWL